MNPKDANGTTGSEPVMEWRIPISAAALVIVGVVAGFVAAKYVSPTPEAPEQVERDDDLTLYGGVTVSTEGMQEAMLENQVAELQSRLAETEAELTQLQNAKLQEFFRETVERLATAAPPGANTDEKVNRLVQQSRMIDNNLWNGPLSFLDSFLLFSDFVGLGNRGVEELLRIAENPDEPLELRQNAVEILTYLPHSKSFEFLMEDHPEFNHVAMESLDEVAAHIERLPTDVVAPYAPRIIEKAEAKLAENPGNSDALRVTGALAWRHQNRQAVHIMAALEFTDINQVQNVIAVARWIDTPQAREYLDTLAWQHPDPAIRDTVRAAMVEW